MIKRLIAILLLGTVVIAQQANTTVFPNISTTNANVTTLCLDSSNRDTCLIREAAGSLAQRNGTSPQIQRIYNTFTDTSNFERLNVGWVGSTAFVSVGVLGTGASQSLRLGVESTSSGTVGLQTLGITRWNVVSAGHLQAFADNVYDFGDATHRIRNAYFSQSIKQVGGITTSGVVGTPAIVATGRSVAATAAVASVSTFTVGAADASFEVSANVLITTSTTHSFNVTCAYTDEGNTARTVTLNFSTLAGVISNAAITNVAGAVPYEGVPLHIRAKAATAITIATTGTFTTVTYNVEGIIKQVS